MNEEKNVLNKEQEKSVKHGKGPLLVIAGAGTGKTRVITERIKYLILEKGIKPSEILALTFTEKAAQEMEERVDRALPMGYIETWISTFHSFCERVLREEAIYIGLDPGYRIISEAESYYLVKRNLSKFKLKYFKPLGNPTKFISGMLTHFSRLKDEDVSPQSYKNFVENPRTRTPKESKLPLGQVSSVRGKQKYEKEELEKLEELTHAYQVYEELKVKNSVMDYADLIANTLKLFRKRPSVLEKYQDKFKYILVDEFQDTNYAQNELVLLLAADDQNITVVADDDQSIYRWRGASVYNVLDFKKHYPKAKTITLTKNYRSGKNILDNAYRLIRFNDPDRLEVRIGVDKKLVPQRTKVEDKIYFLHAGRVEDEAEAVIKEIRFLKKSKNYNYEDIAILVRANNHSEPFVRALSRHGVPYQFLGPWQLYYQPEIKDLLAYLKVLVNFEDNVSFYRLLNAPFLSFNSRDLAGIVNVSRKGTLSFFESVEKKGVIKNLSEETYEKSKKLIKIIHNHLKLLPRESAGQILYYFICEFGYLKTLSDPKNIFEQRRVQNISRFFDRLRSFDLTTEDSSIFAFLDYLDLVFATRESTYAAKLEWLEVDAVNILTVHSAKGLEFPIVFMGNLVNLRFPTVKWGEQIPLPEALIKEPLPVGDPHTQEERRLFYVGMTRAMDRLYFTAADFYGNSKRVKKVSLFVREALGENLEKFKEEIVEEPTLFDWAKIESSPKSLESSEGKVTRAPVDYLSYSQISTFKVCPLQYKFKYILKIPVPPGAAAAYGNSMHTTLRKFYRGLVRGEKRGLDNLLRIFEESWISEGYDSKSLEKERKRQGREALEILYKNFYDPKIMPKMIEQPFKIRVGDIWVKGYIDRIDEFEDGNIEVIDYKTGRVPDEKKLAKDLQLTVYAMAVASPHFLGKNPKDIKLSFYHFEDHKKRSTKRTKEDLKAAEEEILETVKNIQESDFAPSVGMLCKYCNFQMLCDAYQGSLK